MKKATIKEWILTARPKTLAASLSPVIVGCALAYGDGALKWGMALLCAGVALFAQISSNMANDYFDFKHGMDTEKRTGPQRAAASGVIEPKHLLMGALISLLLACTCGLVIVAYSDWRIIFVGIVIALCVFAYSAGPFPLSHHALGDVAVLLFYGIVPVCFTYYVQVGAFSLMSLIYSISMGLLSVNILMVNNYRDCDEDKSVGKITTIVLWGRKFGLGWYLANILIATILPIFFGQSAVISVFMLFAIPTWLKLRKKEGQELNAVLGETSRNVLIFAIISLICIIVLA